jgi:glutamine phosphoribosylpyrophosphate amidotransferase
MCGIAGFSLRADSTVDRTLVAQALLAGIAERGADAVGYAYRGGGHGIRVTKLRGGATALLDRLSVPHSATTGLVHVRDFTKGRPEIAGNNHPIRHHAVVGIHNGVIENDDVVLARHGLRRAAPEMTVDSEAIFALMQHRGHDPRALSQLRGPMAAAWMDEREEARLYVARGRLRPLVVGRSGGDFFFASTRRALSILAAVLPQALETRDVREGRFLLVESGRIVKERRFRPGPAGVRDNASPPVRAPREAVSCLERFAALASAAA